MGKTCTIFNGFYGKQNNGPLITCVDSIIVATATNIKTIIRCCRNTRAISVWILRRLYYLEVPSLAAEEYALR